MTGDRRSGTVAAFDDDAGYGSLVTTDGAAYFFHCTAVSDGSRHVDVGVTVEFTVVPGRLGRWEAAAVEPAET